MRAVVLLFALILLPSAGVAKDSPPPLIVYGAGSTTGVLGEMLKRYEAETGQPVRLETGPAGLMLERIEGGAPADLFVSANMAHPQRLSREGKATATVVFAHNRLCVSARPDVGLTSANLLDKLLDPAIAIGTSTPLADPGGDYALDLFDKADRIRPGAGAVLRAKAQQLVGGTIDPGGPPEKATAKYFLLAHKVDVFTGYCSARSKAADPDLDKIELPPELALRIDYGMAVLTRSPEPARRDAAVRLALWLLSPAAQSMLAAYGFTPAAGEGAAAR